MTHLRNYCRTSFVTSMTIGSFGMVEESQSWTRIIDVAVTKANVGYIAEGADPDAHGVAEISGNASLLPVFLGENGEPPRQTFPISLAIEGCSPSEAKRRASLWPDVMNEITDNDDVIGILFEAEVDESELRRGYLYLHPAQFDKLIGNLATSMEIRFHSRQGVQSECDLIVRVAVWTKTIAPQS